MIRAAKGFAKRHWPALRLRTILFLTFLFVAALPGIGAVFLRVYENTLVQQTEAELIAQAAALSGAYRAAWGAHDVPTGFDPQRPTLDLSETPILPAQPEATRPSMPPDPRAAAAAAALRPIVIDTGRTTLASIRILDPNGLVLLGHGDTGLSYAALPEVRAAGRGETRTVLRERADYRPTYNLEWLSRAAGIRVEYVRPVLADGKVIGILMLSRSPRGLFLGIYQDRGKIALGVGLIFLTLLALAGLLSRGIARPIEALSAATENVARGPVSVPEPPPTAAIEIRALYLSFAAMAERIERRSRYLRDFAAAVSHELKTPISGIKGVIELLEEHPEMNEAERRRFLANAGADADRLSHLLRRLLDLARADMAVTPEGAETDVEGPALTVVDAQRGRDFEVSAEVAGLPNVAVPAEMLTAVLETLVENSRQAGARHVRIAGRAEGERVILSITDDGPGVPDADRERIFDPFHTNRRREGGSGLGLSIARSLLSACGGIIHALPTEKGARFELLLPGTGRGTARSAVEGPAPTSARPLHQPAAGPPPRSGEE
ncbi:MAG TPA: HAMP domain-containing sensor histidine kinase [Allosphingosinicella sp.]|nr:HAMP domain-containing sensor histidine kinase [Allosphingosinicella sp.]